MAKNSWHWDVNRDAFKVFDSFSMFGKPISNQIKLPDNFPFGHFTSKKERERLQNVKRWKMHVQNYCFSLSNMQMLRSSSWFLKLPITEELPQSRSPCPAERDHPKRSPKRFIPESLVSRSAGQGERRLWERDWSCRAKLFHAIVHAHCC